MSCDECYGWSHAVCGVNCPDPTGVHAFIERFKNIKNPVIGKIVADILVKFGGLLK